MQIKIEIDVKPEELRRFLGLPDVAGLQEDVLQFLREKVGAASENFDPASFVKDNLQTLRNSGPWKKIVAAAKARTAGLVPEAEEEAPVAKKRSRAGAKTTGKKRPAARKKAATAAVDPDSGSPQGE